jgi:hypothetical protein
MAIKANLVIDQGTTYSNELDLANENGDGILLTGYTANAQIRKWYTSSNSIAFTTTVNNSTSSITLSLTANQTGAMTAGRYVYDVSLFDTGANTYTRIVEGIVTVTPRVTR